MKTFVGFFILSTIALLTSVQAREEICHKVIQINPVKQPGAAPRCRIVGDTFYFEGVVTDSMYDELSANINRIKTLELNSLGGEVSAAIKIATLVRERGLNTNVRRRALCASACTLIFQAGVRRTISPTTRFLFHSVRMQPTWVQYWLDQRHESGRAKSMTELVKQFQDVETDSADFFNRMVGYGMSQQLIHDYRQQPVDDNWFIKGNFTRTKDWIMDAKELIGYNVAQSYDWRYDVPEE